MIKKWFINKKSFCPSNLNIKYIPTKNYPLQYDEKLNVYYTYHPEFLNREYLFDDVSAKIKQLIDINKCKKSVI